MLLIEYGVTIHREHTQSFKCSSKIKSKLQVECVVL